MSSRLTTECPLCYTIVVLKQDGACPSCGKQPSEPGADRTKTLFAIGEGESLPPCCIYCGNENPHTLGQLYPDGAREKMFAQTCDQCHGYVKMIAAFSPHSPEMLVAHDLGSLPLDFIAQKNGYTRHVQSL